MIDDCQTLINKVEQLRNSLKGIMIIRDQMPHIKKGVNKTPEVASMHAIVCLIKEGLVAVRDEGMKNFNYA